MLAVTVALNLCNGLPATCNLSASLQVTILNGGNFDNCESFPYMLSLVHELQNFPPQMFCYIQYYIA